MIAENMQNDINEVVQDHRALSDWSVVGPDNETIHLPIDMRFNDGHRLSITVYSILMVISSIGNITVLILLIRRRLRGPSRIDVMLMHLAIADLLVTFLLMPMEISWAYTVTWNAGDLMCRIMSFFRTFGLYLSSFVLVCISIDRYFAVLKPLKLSDNRGRIMIFGAWISSFICSAPQAVIFHLEVHPNVTWYEQCVTYNFFENEFHMILYSVMGMVLMYCLPLIIIIFCYTSIYIEIYKKSKKIISGAERFRRSNDDVLGRAKRRTLKMTITIVIVFVVCWTPFYVMSIWYWLDRESALMVDQKVQKGLFLFASTNSCMNPIVYGAFNIRKKHSDKLNTTINHRHASICSTKRTETTNIGGTGIIGVGVGRGGGGMNGRGDSRGSIACGNNHIVSMLNVTATTPSTTTISTTTATINNIRRTICMSCGDSIELPNLRNHNLYH